jgi:hypothetical protein
LLPYTEGITFLRTARWLADPVGREMDVRS